MDSFEPMPPMWKVPKIPRKDEYYGERHQLISFASGSGLADMEYFAHLLRSSDVCAQQLSGLVNQWNVRKANAAARIDEELSRLRKQKELSESYRADVLYEAATTSSRSGEPWEAASERFAKLLMESINREKQVLEIMQQVKSMEASRTATKEVREQLGRADSFLHFILRNAPFSLCNHDSQFRHQFVYNQHPKFQHIIGKTAAELHPEMSMQSSYEMKMEVMATKKTITRELNYYSVDKSFGTKTFLISMEPVTDMKKGNVLALNLACMDVTDQVERREKLAVLREEAAVQRATQHELQKTLGLTEETARAKEMLVTMAREIRAPLSGVFGIADILAKSNLDAEQQKLVTVMMNSGELVQGLTNDILDLSQLETGLLKVDAKPLNVRELAKNVLQMSAASAEVKKLTVEGFVCDKVPQTIVADRLRVRQILVTLVSNAIKFTSQGTIKLAISLSEDVNKALFEVSNTDALPTRQSQTGLVFCKELVERLGGELQVRSKGLIKSCKTLSHVRNAHALLTSRQHLFKQSNTLYLSNMLIQIYGRCGSLHDAFQVFHSISCKNMYSWMYMLLACVHNHQFVEAIRVFNKIANPDTVSGAVMVAVYARHGSMAEAKQTFDTVPRNVVSWNTLVSAYATKRDVDNARLVFHRMPMHDCVTCSTMLSTLAHNSLTEEAEALFHRVPERSTASWTSMLVAYAQNGDLHNAKTMFERMEHRDVVSWTALLAGYADNFLQEEAQAVFERIPMRDTAAFTAMLGSYSRSGRIHQAKSLYDSMPRQDAYSRNAMLAAYSDNGCVLEAKGMFDEMSSRDVIAWNAMSAGFARSGDFKESVAVLERAPMWDTMSWNSMLAVYARAGELDKARALFSWMPLRELLAWNTMLVAYGENGHLRLGVELFHLMHLHGVKPDEVSFLCLLLGCNHRGKVSVARHYFGLMVADFGLQPIKVHYSCMADILGRAGHLEDAEDLIATMPFLPDDVDWHCLLSSCKIHSDEERGTRAAGHAIGIANHDSTHLVLFSSFLRTESCSGDY